MSAATPLPLPYSNPTSSASDETEVRADLCRLARFGANISDAHSCFIFLPAKLLRPEGAQVDERMLEMGGFHSLCDQVIGNCRLVADSGLIGWVAKHHRSIHVSPFEHDSRTLGTYNADQQLKSFIGIPVFLGTPDAPQAALGGVIACDSKKAFAFSKLQGKLLENLAAELSNIVRLRRRPAQAPKAEISWAEFLNQGTILGHTLGMNSLEVVRVRTKNFEALEMELGSARAIELFDQVHRLIQQTLPPHFPTYRLPSGDLVILLDNMLTSFYENRIVAICDHLKRESPEGSRAWIEVGFVKASFTDKRLRAFSLEQMIALTAQPIPTESAQRGFHYEFRRA
jgi:hypothetical protein